MPTLDRDERQQLRALQEYLIGQATSAGAEYTTMSTVGVIHHGQDADPDMNMVVPHRGVAWTRLADITYAFEFLRDNHREPQFRYLEKLFPEAFSKQLKLGGLDVQSSEQFWVYKPLKGPVLPDEVPYAQYLQDGKNKSSFTVKSSETANDRQTWRSFVQEFTTETIDPTIPLKHYYWLGYHENNPIGALIMLADSEICEIHVPLVKDKWTRMGLEKQLINTALGHALSDGNHTIYAVSKEDHAHEDLRTLGFVPFTKVYTYA